MSTDKFNFNGYPVTGPGRDPENFTKSNSGLSVTNSIEYAHKVYVGYGGTVAVYTKTGSAVFYGVPTGGVIPCTHITHVLSTTTTASAFVALQ